MDQSAERSRSQRAIQSDSSPVFWEGPQIHSHLLHGNTGAKEIVGIANHKLKRMVSVNIPEGTTGTWGTWMGVTPSGAPLLLRDLSIFEVYALDVDLP